MEIVLLEKIPNLGDLGDIVSVKNGYARNYLIPNQKARRATEVAKAEVAANLETLRRAQAMRESSLKALAMKVEGMSLNLPRKAQPDGRLFGSVSNHDLMEAFAALGVEVPKSAIQMPHGALKQVGKYDFVALFGADARAQFSVVISEER